MRLDAFVIRLVFLALPGILALKVYRKLRGRTRKEVWESFLEILLFSLSSYLVLGLFQTLCHIGRPPAMPTTQSTVEPYVIQSVFDPALPLDWFQIAYACLIALALASIASWLHKNKVVNRAGMFGKLSNRLSDEDVWEVFFGTPNIH